MSNTSCPTRSRAPRVLFVDHTAQMGGGEVALLNLVSNLDRSRYEPVVLLFSEGPLREALQEAGVETHLHLLSPKVMNTRKDTLGWGAVLRILDAVALVPAVLRLAKRMISLNVRLVHTNSLKADLLGGIAARLSGHPVLWHVRDRIEDDYLPKPAVWAFRRLCRVIPDAVIANSSATLETLRLQGRKPSAAIPSGFKVRHRNVVHDGTQSRTANGSQPWNPRETQVVGLVGRIAPWKGQRVFIEAAKRLHRDFPHVRFQIVGCSMFGEEAYEAEIRAAVKEANLERVVEFLGHRTDVPELMEQFTVLVHASTTGEPFGQVVIEGMSAGRAVVATNGGGIPEIVEDGVNGILVPMGDAEAMSRAIGTLLTDPALRARLGEAGSRRVNERFTIEHTVGRLQAIYDAFLAGTGDQLGRTFPESAPSA